jgi:hypothetical protein
MDCDHQTATATRAALESTSPASAHRDLQQPRARNPLPPVVPSREELASMSDREIGALLTPGELCRLVGVESEIALRLWCRDRGTSRAELRDLLEGRRLPRKRSFGTGGRT